MTSVMSLVQDNTERRRAEAALRESEESLNLALLVGGIATWDLRVDTGEVVWNREHFLMLGYEPGETQASYEAFLARVHPDDAAAVDAAFRDSLDHGSDYVADFRVVRPDGDVRTISAVGHLEVDASGAPLRQYGVMFDVTERVEAERALRRAEAERAAQAERSRLARDLHDSVTQALFAASLKAEALASSPELVAPAGRDIVEEVRRLNRGALAQMRTMLLELRGDRIEQVPLQHLLRNLVESAESRASIHVRLVVEGEPTSPARRPRRHLSRRAGGEQHHPARARQRRLGGSDAAAGVRPTGRRRRRRRLRPLGHGPQPYRPGLHARARRRDRRPPHGDHGAGQRTKSSSTGRSRGPGSTSTIRTATADEAARTTWRGNVEDRRGMAGRGMAVVGVRRHRHRHPAGRAAARRRPVGDPERDGRREPVERERPDAGGSRDQAAQFASVVLADTEDVWRQQFREMGRTYRDPRMVLFTGYVRVRLRPAIVVQVGPFYCRATRRSTSTSPSSTSSAAFGAPGDFAQAYVIAHEVGHHRMIATSISRFWNIGHPGGCDVDVARRAAGRLACDVGERARVPRGGRRLVPRAGAGLRPHAACGEGRRAQRGARRAPAWRRRASA